MSSIRTAALGALAALGLSATAAAAAVTWTLEETGGDVVGSFSGTIDLSGATFFDFGGVSTFVAPADGNIGNRGAGTGAFDIYLTTSGPGAFGPGGFTSTAITDGDAFGLVASNGWMLLPRGYVSGGAISGTQTFEGASFASLGLTPGTYVFDLPGDSATLEVGAAQAAAVPLPAGLPLMLGALGAIAALRRRGA